MLSEIILNALNEQISREKFASITYEQMSCWFANQGLYGFHEYIALEAKHEQEHACKFVDYILQQNGRVTLAQSDAPKLLWENPIDVFEDVLRLEQSVTEAINSIMILAVNENDFATQSMLQWFIDEQVKSEHDAICIIQKLRMIGDDASALLALDNDMGHKTVGDDF
jgi:ferritin